jgi:hypothetical protein
MASIKNLKKNINYLASEIITEAYIRKILFDGIKEDDFKKVVSDAIEFRNELIAKANHHNKKDSTRKAKVYFQNVRQEMKQKFSELINAVNNLEPV